MPCVSFARLLSEPSGSYLLHLFKGASMTAQALTLLECMTPEAWNVLDTTLKDRDEWLTHETEAYVQKHLGEEEDYVKEVVHRSRQFVTKSDVVHFIRNLSICMQPIGKFGETPFSFVSYFTIAIGRDNMDRVDIVYSSLCSSISGAPGPSSDILRTGEAIALEEMIFSIYMLKLFHLPRAVFTRASPYLRRGEHWACEVCGSFAIYLVNIPKVPTLVKGYNADIRLVCSHCKTTIDRVDAYSSAGVSAGNIPYERWFLITR
jgi:hypothetical protein